MLAAPHSPAKAPVSAINSPDRILPSLAVLGAEIPDAARSVPVSGVAYRSTAVRPGDVFFAIRGFAHDGHDYAADAVRRGATLLVVERRLPLNVPQVVLADTRVALAKASAAFFGEPSKSMDVVGITGTNGKTTTAYLVDAILREAGRVTGLVGTVETRIADERRPAERTTPESADLQALLAEMRDRGVSGVAMEVSSHAIDLHRVDDVSMAVVAFTNLTQDHLDYHHTLEEYASVKRRLFEDFEVGARVVNVDDPMGAAMASELDVAFRVGRAGGADVTATNESRDARGSDFTLRTASSEARLRLPLAGAYNVSNALVAAGCGLALGITMDVIARGLEAAPQVPGRLERVEAGQPFSVIVDYAHTPDSLDKAIAAVKAVTRGRVIVVFGCGGDRDPEKRPLMGRAAGRLADHVVVTTDNPRSEDPVGIILQIEDGLRDVGATWEVEVDRRSAIAAAISQAEVGRQRADRRQGPRGLPDLRRPDDPLRRSSRGRRGGATDVLRATVGTLVRVTGGKLIGGNRQTVVSGLTIDSRMVPPGAAFVALLGEHSDGHDHLYDAVLAGAHALVVTLGPDELSTLLQQPQMEGVSVIRVADGAQALRDLAAWHRTRLTCPVIGITGSTGKTTTKDMLRSVLERDRRVVATEGNRNNELGVPLTVLSADPLTEALIVEMGMRGLGQIAELAAIVRPSFGLVTNVGTSHIELLDTEESVADAKSELIASLPPDGLAFLNGDDAYSDRIEKVSRARVRRYGLSEWCDVRAEDISLDDESRASFTLLSNGDRFEISLSVPGRHNVYNALAAAAIALELGVAETDIAEGLADVHLTAMRMQMFETATGLTVINDAYNANPVSMRAAIETLLDMRAPARRVAVLGDMAELGSLTELAHFQLGELVGRRGVDVLVTVGQRSARIGEGARVGGMPPENVRVCATVEEAGEVLDDVLQPGDIVLVKASRVMGLERIVEGLVTPRV